MPSATAPVLIVEDAPELRMLLEIYLLQLGFSSVSLPSGQHALASAKELRPRFIVLDIMLPNVCGLELCEAITRDPELAHIPVILMSARTAPRDRANAELAGAAAFLPKPLSMHSLSECLASLRLTELAA